MKNIKTNLLAVLAGMLLLSSCNKDLEQFAPITVPAYPTGATVGATLAASTNDSLFARLLTRTGMINTLRDSTKTFTIFAVDNAGMKVFVNGATSGIIPLNAPDAVFSAFINGTNTTVYPPLTIALNLPIASAVGIAQYLTVGQKLPAASIATTFPNFPYTSQIILDPTQPFVRMNLFPVRGTTYSYLNNIPITSVDQTASNGLIHRTFTIAAPPSVTLKSAIGAETSLKYFRAAVARADSGATGLSRLDSLLNYGVTNMTVLAPNDAAFQGLLIPLITGALIAQGVPPLTAATQATAIVNAVDGSGNPTVFSNPALFASLPAATVRGIIAYHFLASLTTSTTSPYQPNIRVFSVNIPSTPTFVKTLVNGSVAAHPGISARATYSGPIATAATFTGFGTLPGGGTPYSGPAANATVIDRHAVNGVYHIIDRVLLPQ